MGKRAASLNDNGGAGGEDNTDVELTLLGVAAEIRLHTAIVREALLLLERKGVISSQEIGSVFAAASRTLSNDEFVARHRGLRREN